MLKKIVIGNWKMNPQTIAQSRVLASRVDHGLTGVDRKKVEVVIAPPTIFLPIVRHSTHFALLGAQNVSCHEKGPYTGQISVGQLEEFGVKFVLIGHSEVREAGETEKAIKIKYETVKKRGIRPVLCVGHGVKKNSALGTIKRVISKQLKSAIDSGNKIDEAIIAYEPVWAIGSGRSASPEHASEIAEYIKGIIPKARVLYGGSINEHNVQDFADSGIDGVLVGGSSLDFQDFLSIIKFFAI